MVKKVAGLEITSESIRIVELEKDAKATYLKNMASIPTPAGAVKDGEIIDIDGVVDTIRKILSRALITTKRVVISLSGKGVVIQEITLPSMPYTEMKEVIKSELENYPIFKKDDFVFDYQPLSEFTEKGYKRTRVFFVGISSRFINSYLTCIQKAGLSLVSIDVAPLSMATSQYPDLKEDKATASVLIKDEKTYVTVVKKGRFCLFYNIDIGTGQLLYSGLHQENNLNEEVLKKLVSELERSFKFYEIEFEKEKIGRVILSYDHSKLPLLDKRIASILNSEIEIKVINPLKHIKVPAEFTSNSMVKEGAEAYAVAVGAALKGLNIITHNLHLELLQKYIPRHEELKKKSILVAISCLLIVLITAGITGYHNAVFNELRASLKEKEIQLASLDSRLKELKDLAERHRYLRERLKRQASYLKRLNRISWSVVLSKVTQQIPEDVWLKIFNSTDRGKLTLEGGTLSVDNVADFIRGLGQEPTFENTGLGTINQERFSEGITGVKFRLESELSVKKEKEDGSPEIENE